MSNRTHDMPAGRGTDRAQRRLRVAVRPLAVLFSAGALLVLPPSPIPVSEASAPAKSTADAERHNAERRDAERHNAERHDAAKWQGGWATSIQPPGRGLFPNWSQQGFHQQTLRQVIRVSTGGTGARFKLSNRYGTSALKVAGATVGRTDRGAAVRKGTSRPLTFDEQGAVTIPVGGEVFTDALSLRVRALESLTVTLYLAEPTGPATYHMSASATSYRALGDHRPNESGEAFTETSASWYYLSDVEIQSKAHGRRNGVVAFGDSITDGFASTIDGDNRYPDELAERFVRQGRPRSVLNHGISGNMITFGTPGTGESGVDRFAKDVLAEPEVKTVIVLEGINDIGLGGTPGGQIPDVSVEQLITAHRNVIRQAHAKGLKVIGATLVPFKGAGYYTERGETKRDALNEWIRTSRAYDAVIDLDHTLADPTDPDRLTPAYDSGDHLHPSDAGYHAMAEAIDIDAL
ncbi:SGNH/GDSL hydrolase family protein [Streptomyces zagrosensis]|uniref:Lysophospholipase L1-like esterase n=1 Tax=Streptomyces zagrosensis TaxID=1042984 RepID=A0A7W9QDW7_9ACTN|nr:SGNH/GDSL hydrolase family protein [Streptomyces zagrosensis]MBB5938498.1 lysophospholipase L1-like esterase [Streptomyces zagrosensis]